MIFCTYFYDMNYIFFRNRLINMSKQIFSILVLIELFCNSRYCSKLRIQQKYTFPLVPENDTSRTKNSTEKVIMCDCRKIIFQTLMTSKEEFPVIL